MKEIYGLIGYPVKHSLSKAMQEAAFKHYGINAEYRLFEITPEKLEDFLLKDIQVKDVNGNSIWARELAGFNITIPHKVKAKEMLLGETTNLIEGITIRQDHYVFLSGAINTIKRDKDKVKLIYGNTDAEGFIKSLKEDLNFDTKGKSVIIFGCGGAGRALVAGLTWKSVFIKKIYLYDTNREAIDSAKKHFSRFAFLKEQIEFIAENQISEKIEFSHLLANASPVGMKEGDSSIIDKSLLARNKNLSVFDVVYNRETQLIKDAKGLGLSSAGGLNMLLYQGAAAFELWTDKKAPIDKMRAALLKELNASSH